MPCTALEEKDSKEQLVMRLIRDYGTPPERLGQAFRHAERTTNAEVAIVRLKKPVATTGKFGFEVRNDLRLLLGLLADHAPDAWQARFARADLRARYPKIAALLRCD